MSSALPPLTLFSARVCPWAQRVTLAAREVGLYDGKQDVQFEHYEIDLQDKPSWYASKINPASKVPVLQIGKDDDANVKRIPESAVLLELVAELFPSSDLSPTDPIQRAEARYFAERFTGVATGPFNQIFLFGKTEQAPAFLTGIEEIQGLLAKTEGDFLLGDQLSIGDLAVAPFVGRFFAAGKAGLLPDEVYSALTTDAKFEPFRKYHATLTSRPSWAATFDEDYVIGYTKKRIEKIKADAAAAK